jgi:3-hydroxyisobutyrate dehydrogenase-like beta-hydroxyacid dehydrogenase
MSDVSVIGLGAMGSALARTLLRAGHRVTVWNRTSTKTGPLARDGAIPARDPAAAVLASPIVLVCVDTTRSAARSSRQPTSDLPWPGGCWCR